MEFSHGLAQWDFNTPKIVAGTVAYPRSFITDHWFFEEQDTTKALQVTRLLYLINYHYSIRQYDQTLQYIQQGLDLNYSKKKEFLEIKARVLNRLGRFNEGLEIIDLIQSSFNTKKIDPSLTFLKGQLNSKVGNYLEALNCFLDYLNSRTDDYSAWVEMSRIAVQISKGTDIFHGITAHDWNVLAGIMIWISKLLYNRPTSSCGELLEISKRKRASQDGAFNQMTEKQVEYAISLLENEFQNLGKFMHLSCLQLGIIEV
jgi:tetratricopeptide (TPR) repeat protein